MCLPQSPCHQIVLSKNFLINYLCLWLFTHKGRIVVCLWYHTRSCGDGFRGSHSWNLQRNSDQERGHEVMMKRERKWEGLRQLERGGTLSSPPCPSHLQAAVSLVLLPPPHLNEQMIKCSMRNNNTVVSMSTHSTWVLLPKYYSGDFPVGPEAKTPNSQCRGPGFDLWSGARSHMPQLRVHMLQLRPSTTTQTNIFFKDYEYHSPFRGNRIPWWNGWFIVRAEKKHKMSPGPSWKVREYLG